MRPGDVIAGKYRVLHEIGRGGMGVVVAADHLLLPQEVAIKLLKRDADPVSLARFEREAHVVVQLRSEHVCRVLDVGALESGEPFIVMERLEGCDLAAGVEREGPLPRRGRSKATRRPSPTAARCSARRASWRPSSS